MLAIEALRVKIKTEEFDYAMLMSVLSYYRKPRDVVTRLLKQGAILRVKKGLYVFAEVYRKGILCKESLANLIYGPSYISLEYALYYYGLIPERVEQVTSMTVLKSKTFTTPLGVFAYVHLNPKKVAVGITQVKIDLRHQVLMATPEKALADRLSFHKNLMTSQDVLRFICEGLRIEEEALSKLSLSLLDDIREIYKNPAVTALTALIKELQC